MKRLLYAFIGHIYWLLQLHNYVRRVTRHALWFALDIPLIGVQGFPLRFARTIAGSQCSTL